MTSQVIKYTIDNSILFDLLDKICKKYNNKYYILNKVSFKIAVYHNYTTEFCDKIKDNYYLSKKNYVTRRLDYSKFITIIRQICKSNNINFTSKIIYDKSDYDIVYYIYFNTSNCNTSNGDTSNTDDGNEDYSNYDVSNNSS